VEALAELDGRAAVTWLLRLVNDPCPAIRQVVAEALAVRDDPRKVAALRRLTDHADIEVGDAAGIAPASLRGPRRAVGGSRAPATKED